MTRISNRAQIAWLAIVCATIFAMIVVGGVTRLTESGLSMVDWQPLIGIVPPLNEADWQAAFDAYKEYPQYQQVNSHMGLAGFKEIFYWEYGHRVLGRLIGVVFFVPFVVFWLMGKIEARMMPKLLVALGLGALQGLLGWYMVKSGLIDIPRVSHYRLAAHLLLAMFIFCYLYWLILDLMSAKRVGSPPAFRRLVYVLAGVATLQILYGAFTAGIRAGYGYNTFPLMYDKFMADAVFYMSPWWINLFESSATIQFIHRWLAALLLVLAFAVWLLSLWSDVRLQWAAAAVSIAVLVQFTLGVLTLINIVPIGLASLHQAWACVLLLTLVYLLYVSTSRTRAAVE